MPKDLSFLGLNFIVGLDGPVLLPAELRMLKQLQPAGIILFAKNIAPGEGDSWIPIMQALIADARAACGREDLIVAVDHEGGRVHRFRPPVTQFPYARYWANRSAAVGRCMARELRALGFTVNFAPVLDIHSEPLNPVIGLRAFGTTVDSVTNAALAYADALATQGVIPCGKHFPGHGATVSDSHHELPVLEASLPVLIGREVEPFRRFIETAPPLLMSAHVRYPEFDAENPATISKRILTDFLRGELAYEGALITDDLEMKALEFMPPGKRAEACLLAGIDILLQGYSGSAKLPLEIAIEMAEGVSEALSTGSLAQARVAEAQSRVKILQDVSRNMQAHAELSSYPISLLGSEEHTSLLREVLNEKEIMERQSASADPKQP